MSRSHLSATGTPSLKRLWETRQNTTPGVSHPRGIYAPTPIPVLEGPSWACSLPTLPTRLAVGPVMLLGPWRLPQAELPSPSGRSCCQELEVPGDR